MNVLSVVLDADDAWKDLRERESDIIHLKSPKISIGRLQGGMASGQSSVAIRIDLPNGKVVIAELSISNFLNCARFFNGAEEKLK